MKIADKIRKMRAKAGFTQEQLANKLGVSSQSVSKWETGVAMPDIMLLPIIAETFGISIDELFDLTLDEKLKRIENRIEIEEEFSDVKFKEYEELLKAELSKDRENVKILSLLASLYHHRMETDSRRVSKYARESIILAPEKKECQWLLTKAEGSAVWDWNVANHTSAIDFYKEVILSDKGEPKSALPYYYLIDNLLSDNRVDEAEHYLSEFKKLPSANPIMSDIYRAYILLGRFDPSAADEVIYLCEEKYPENSIFLFEAAQYFARRCEYEKAIKYYERAWETEKSPKFTDAMQAIAIINKIIGNKEAASLAYDKILDCLKNDWGYSEEDKPYIDTIREKEKL